MAILKNVFAILIFTQIVITSFAQKHKKNYLVAFSDTSSGKKLWGFKTATQKIAITPQYDIVSATIFYDFVFVTKNNKWVAINKKNNVIFTPYIIDNIPNFLDERFYRFIENGKIGFANAKGKKVIPAQFDYAAPFGVGLSAFCVGGKLEKIDSDYSTWSGGLWGFINKKGKIVIKPQFKKAFDFTGATCIVFTQENKCILIDQKGNTVKTLNE